jgi:hypothetical protein
MFLSTLEGIRGLESDVPWPLIIELSPVRTSLRVMEE